MPSAAVALNSIFPIIYREVAPARAPQLTNASGACPRATELIEALVHHKFHQSRFVYWPCTARDPVVFALDRRAKQQLNNNEQRTTSFSLDKDANIRLELRAQHQYQLYFLLHLLY